MHMAFLSRVFKNLQWYGMTKRTPPNRVVFFLYPEIRTGHERSEKTPQWGV